ncbi:uncharacterized protein BO66DRAFT_396144 [Aspergillus aculeatinus CBS 121060]|uniref:Uncharacterized protein n=1 Tax=Aspergillus aculeatinus CBS 121060 TaxID=1448322 RepID=A0ACD1GTM2_9EURO|nr:hypothetical protein BO66DRAFT_396144 [Aspergillus aculeatinus CBS 121060]RAH64483.1 hypothetical protein BO66DRAFT_396144 [Aspergillus aculeatinus CBS 121060]
MVILTTYVLHEWITAEELHPATRTEWSPGRYPCSKPPASNPEPSPKMPTEPTCVTMKTDARNRPPRRTPLHDPNPLTVPCRTKTMLSNLNALKRSISISHPAAHHHG